MHLTWPEPCLYYCHPLGIAIFTTTFLFMGSANLTPGIVIQGVCMFGSAAYLRKHGEIFCTGEQEI